MDPHEALKSIKTLAEVATESDDLEFLRKHLQMIADITDKVSKPAPRSSAHGQ